MGDWRIQGEICRKFPQQDTLADDGGNGGGGDDMPGGESDSNYQPRFKFANLAANGASLEGGGPGAEGGSRLLTPRERL